MQCGIYFHIIPGMELTTADIITLLGGKDRAAEYLGVGEWTPYKWHNKGIPAKHWKAIAERLNLKVDEVANVRPAKPSDTEAA